MSRGGKKHISRAPKKRTKPRFSKKTVRLSILLVAVVIGVVLAAVILINFNPQVKVEGKAVLVDALQPNEAFTRQTVDFLEEAGYEVDVFSGEEITVDFFKEFPTGYELIILRVHSSLYQNEGVYFFTGESYDISKYMLEQMTGDVKRAFAFDGSPPVFAISSSFVGMYMKEKFEDAVIIAMGCDSISDPIMPMELIDQGAEAYIGWNGLVTLPYTDEAILKLLQSVLIEKLTWEEALNLIEPDPDYGAKLVYYS